MAVGFNEANTCTYYNQLRKYSHVPVQEAVVVVLKSGNKLSCSPAGSVKRAGVLAHCSDLYHFNLMGEQILPILSLHHHDHSPDHGSVDLPQLIWLV